MVARADSSLAVLAVASGVTSTRGTILLVLAPSVAFGGLAGARQVFFVLYETRRLAVIDPTTNAIQLAATVLIAEMGGGVIGVAIVMSTCAIANNVIVAAAAFRLVDTARPARDDYITILRRVLPLGLVSVMATVYFSVDLVLLAWLVGAKALGGYAAACKVLSLMVVLPMLLMSAALPALSTSAFDADALRALSARLLHWLAAVGLPICVGVAVFAKPLVRLAWAGFHEAVPLVRILSMSGVVALVTNVLGNLLVARSIVRPMLLYNAFAIAFNVLAISSSRQGTASLVGRGSPSPQSS